MSKENLNNKTFLESLRENASNDILESQSIEDAKQRKAINNLSITQNLAKERVIEEAAETPNETDKATGKETRTALPDKQAFQQVKMNLLNGRAKKMGSLINTSKLTREKAQETLNNSRFQKENLIDVNKPIINDQGEHSSHLIEAVKKGNSRLVNNLLKKGADPQLKILGKSALNYALDLKNIDMTNSLVKKINEEKVHTKTPTPLRSQIKATPSKERQQ